MFRIQPYSDDWPPASKVLEKVNLPEPESEYSPPDLTETLQEEVPASEYAYKNDLSVDSVISMNHK